jgi:hypothetical protein
LVSDNFVFDTSRVNQALSVPRLAPGFKARGNQPVVLITLTTHSPTVTWNDAPGHLWQVLQLPAQLIDVKLAISPGYLFAHRAKPLAKVWLTSIVFVQSLSISGRKRHLQLRQCRRLLANIPSRFRQAFDVTSAQTNTYSSFFIRMSGKFPQLLLNYGLRYERESIVRT